MNTKTTLVLALVAAGIAGYVLLVDKPWEQREAQAEPETVAVALFDTKFEDADRVEIVHRGGKRLVFARTGDTETDKRWMILEPFEAPATEYQVKAIIDKVAGIKFDRKYGPKDADRPSDKVSGLGEPAVTVRLAKGDAELANIAIGEAIPMGSGTYAKVNTDVTVKVDGDEEMTVAAADVLETQNDLSDAFDVKIADLRDKNVMKFDLKDVSRVTVEGDRNFVLVKNGENWTLESPVRARADKTRVESLVRALSNLYVAEFKDDNPAGYKAFNLDPARMKVTIETEKTIPPKAKPGDPDTQPADIEPTTELVKHELLIGGAVDAEAKQYFARLGDKPWVFAINDYTYKQVNAGVTDLQDKSLAGVDTGKVKTVQVETPQGAATLTRQADGTWTDAQGEKADALAVQDLLKAVSELKAVDFVDPQAELVMVDWEKPRAKVTLTEEGSINPVTVLVGPASPSGKMAYVRNAAEEPVAAVHEDAVVTLLAGPVAYRDRSVVRFDRARAVKVEIDQAGKDAITLTQKNNEWSMSAPIEASVDRDGARNLMQSLSNLRATRIVDQGNLAEYGLDEPEVTLAVYVEPITNDPNVEVVGETTKPADQKPAATQPAADASARNKPTTTRPGKTVAQQIEQIKELLEYQKTNPDENPLATEMLKKRLAELEAQATQPSAGDDAAVGDAAVGDAAVGDASPKPAPQAEPAPQREPDVLRLVLHLAQKDGRTYAAVDGSDLVYEVDNQVFTDATAELHDRQIVEFDTPDVAEVRFIGDDGSVGLRKSGEDWKYIADSLLPIDKDKVKTALDELKDIKTPRYVSYDADLSKFGLDDPAKRFAVVLSDGRRVEVLVSDKGPENDPDDRVYGVIAGQKKVFLLDAGDVEKMTRQIEDFEKAAVGANT